MISISACPDVGSTHSGSVSHILQPLGLTLSQQPHLRQQLRASFSSQHRQQSSHDKLGIVWASPVYNAHLNDSFIATLELDSLRVAYVNASRAILRNIGQNSSANLCVSVSRIAPSGPAIFTPSIPIPPPLDRREFGHTLTIPPSRRPISHVPFIRVSEIPARSGLHLHLSPRQHHEANHH